MQKENIHKKITSIDEWLIGHKKLLFILSIALVIAIDVYNVVTIDINKLLAINSQDPKSYTEFLQHSLYYNLFAILLIPCYFIPLRLRNLCIYLISIIVLYHLYYFLAIKPNNAAGLHLTQITETLSVYRRIFYFVFAAFHLFTKVKRPSREFVIYIVLLILYFPFYYLADLVILFRK